MKLLRLLVLLVTLTLLLGGCGEKEVPSSQLEEQQGVTYLVDSGKPFTGKSFELHENGQKELEINYKNGKQDGLEVWWHDNGKKKHEYTYKDGKLVEGSYKFWNSKGEPVDTFHETFK